MVREVTGAVGPVSHVPRQMLRPMSVALRPIRPILADQIQTAVVMDTRDMTADAAERARHFPAVPLTPLRSVVAGRFPEARSVLADRRADG